MTEDVLNWIKKEKLMTEGDTVIVGLSGGADSVALLLVLLELRQRIGYTLLAIHVEHGIRGEESRKDAAFVEELCRQKNIPCGYVRSMCRTMQPQRESVLRKLRGYCVMNVIKRQQKS